MGRNLTGCGLVLLIGLGVAAPSAEAKDRKSAAAGDREPLADVVTARAAISSPAREFSSGSRNGKPYAPLADQPELRSNPLRVKIGAVAIQPSIGGINGARFSIGF